MIIRSITPADQEQLLLLEEELRDNEGKEHRAILEEAPGSKPFLCFAEQAGDAVAYLLATEDSASLKRKPNRIAIKESETGLSRSRLCGSILIAAFKD